MQLIRALTMLVLILFAVFYSDKLLGFIQLNDVMSSAEQKKTGIYQLNDSQRQELEKWINDTFVLKTATPTTPSPAPLTLQENLQGGAQLQLSDGSVYAIAPSDQAKATFWLTPIPMTVSQSNDPMYPVLLTNTLSGVSVRAKQVKPPLPPSQQL